MRSGHPNNSQDLWQFIAVSGLPKTTKKNVSMIYAYVIHTCLDVALATKLENYKKMYSWYMLMLFIHV